MTAALADVTPHITADEARALTDDIRADLASAVAKFRTAIEQGAPAALGYPSAWAWAEAELGDLVRELRLPRTLRLAMVEAMTDAGVPVREQSERLGVSLGTIQNDKAELGRVIPLGTARRRRGCLPAPAGPVWEQAAEWLRRAGDRGLTRLELAGCTGWSEGKASGALSYLGPATARHPQYKGLAVGTEEFRAGQRVHVLTAD